MNRDRKKYFTDRIMPHSAKMYGVAFAILGSQEDASDAVQTAMLRIWKIVSEGSEPENPGAYCLSTVRNICLNEILRAKKLVALEGEENLPVAGDNTESSITLKEVALHLSSLPEKERRAIELTAYAGCSSEDVATALSVTPANARQILSRGRRKLRDLFK